jgi:hypothetical protein
VHERIQQRLGASWPVYMRAHRVGWSFATVVAVVAAGWAGHSAARVQLDAGREKMAVSYLVKLDPRVLAKLRP